MLPVWWGKDVASLGLFMQRILGKNFRKNISTQFGLKSFYDNKMIEFSLLNEFNNCELFPY